MDHPIRIHTSSTGWIEGIICTEENSMTAIQVLNALPFESQARLWGDEVYFEVPVKMTEENARIEVEVGSLAFWPAGNCMCIFFGRTPASRSNLPAAASPVNVFGRITSDLNVLCKVKPGEKIRVERTEQA